MMQQKKRILLALSGGLDTSFCAVYLAREKQYEVHSAIVNTGGFTGEELEAVDRHARKLGVASHATLDATGSYYDQCIRYMIFGNVLRNRNYPLSVSSERTFQAIALVEYAKEKGFDAIAHGSTAAGNDQVRFDLVIQVLAPHIDIVTPIRELGISREKEVEYLKESGVDMKPGEVKYSINQGLWGTSVGGKETLTSHLGLPDHAFPGRVVEEGSKEIEIGFSGGEVTSLDGKQDAPVALIRKLEAIGSSFGIGRDVHVGDTIIGIKGRVGFSAPAARILIDAHLALEKHVLTRWQLYWKEQIGNWYGMFIHEAQFLEPVMRNLESFLLSSQQNVTGKVFLTLHPYRFEVTGVESGYDLMDASFASYGEENRGWTAADVDGFIKVMSIQQKIWYQKNNTK
jgi:argininosuccinate synthase